MIRDDHQQRPITLLPTALATALALAGCNGDSQSPQVVEPQTTAAAASPTPELDAAPPPTEVNGGEPPVMTFSHASHDFGLVSDTLDHTHTFDFVNTGGSVLNIESVETSCGCTTARAASEQVAPGEHGEIEVTYDPRGFGKHSYRITVVSNTGAPSQLQIQAEVDPFLVIEPRRLELGTLAVHEPHTALVTVLCRDPDMTVESVRTQHAHIKAEILGDAPTGSPGTSEGRSRSVIRFVIDQDAAWGELRTTCLITVKGTPAASDEPIEHTAYLPISALVFGELYAEPATFRLGVIQSGEPFEHSIRLYRQSSEPFQVREVTIARSNIAGIEVRAEPFDDEGLPGYRIILTADLGEYLGPVHGSVKVATDVAGEDPNEISFSGIVRTGS